MKNLDIRSFDSFIELKKRFLSRVPKKYFTTSYNDKCWYWRAENKNPDYRQLKWGGKMYLVHRLSYLIFNGLIPLNKIVRHTCDNPSCINPKHLILGTHYDNSIDSVKNNRQGHQKLNIEAVKVIKWMLKYKNKRGLTKKLSILYDVDASTITHIKKGDQWGWVEV